MKKFKNTLSIFIIGILSVSISFAELEITDISVIDNTSTGVLENSEIQTITTTSEKIENPSYIYYYGQGCSHCANLDKYINGVDGYEKLNIVKKEVYFDDKNRQDMLDDGKRLGLSESEIGVPFMIENKAGVETSIIGDGPIIERLKPILGEVPENNKKPIVFTILIIIAIIVPVFLIKLSNKS